MTYLQILSHKFVEGLKKSTKNFGHDVRISRPNLGPAIPAYGEGIIYETARCKETKVGEEVLAITDWGGGRCC